jgi:hypothetical protein
VTTRELITTPTKITGAYELTPVRLDSPKLIKTTLKGRVVLWLSLIVMLFLTL